MKKYAVSSCRTRTFGDHSCGSDRVFPMRGESSTEKTWRETMVINLLGFWSVLMIVLTERQRSRIFLANYSVSVYQRLARRLGS